MATTGAKEGEREVVKSFKDIQESNNAMKDVIQFQSKGDQINISSLPYMLTEHQSNVIK